MSYWQEHEAAAHVVPTVRKAEEEILMLAGIWNAAFHIQGVSSQLS